MHGFLEGDIQGGNSNILPTIINYNEAKGGNTQHYIGWGDSFLAIGRWERPVVLRIVVG